MVIQSCQHCQFCVFAKKKQKKLTLIGKCSGGNLPKDMLSVEEQLGRELKSRNMYFYTFLKTDDDQIDHNTEIKL